MIKNERVIEKTDPELDEKQIAELIEKHNQNSVWIIKRYNKLRKELPNKYVAVRNGKIVYNSDNLTDLLRELREKFKNIDDVAIDFITEKPLKLLL
jgi:hypothetical protein